MKHPPAQQSRTAAYMQAAVFSLAETLWPTRCVVCDTPGDVLCPLCRSSLDWIDYWQACPVCGAPWGRHQCTECNEIVLRGLGYAHVPYDRMVCAVRFDEISSSIVRAHKDAGERRAVSEMAYPVACVIPPEWLPFAQVTYIPATKEAKVRRGFDHGAALGEEVARLLNLSCSQLLEPACTHDQRVLSRKERFANLAHAFKVLPKTAAAPPQRVILIDDVVTTTATLSAAANALKSAGVLQVFCAGFARVY